MIDQFTTGVGIDISEHHVRFAQVSVFGRVKELSEVTLPDGLIVDERVEKVKEVKSILKKKLAKSPLMGCQCRATLLLPESHVFSSSFVLPRTVKGKEVLEEAKKIAQREIPLPFSQADVAVSQGGVESGGIRTTLYAIDSQVAAGFQEILSVTPFSLVAMEANTKSILRLIARYRDKKFLPKNSKELIAIVDIGHSWTTIAVYTLRGSNVFSRSISYKRAGECKTRESHLSKDVVDSIVETIGQIMVYFKQREQKVTSIYLSGVEALDKNLNAKLDKISSKEVPVLALGKAIKIAKVNEKELHIFGAAIGAAIRPVFHRRYAYQHNLLTKRSKEKV